MAIYRIKNWDANFENNRTRKMKNMMWIPVPNKHDGDGYTELVARDNGAEMLGAWLAILQVASRCAERGTLMRDNGTPHTAKSISRISRLGEESIELALSLLCCSEVDWVEVVDSEVLAVGCAIGAPSAHPTDEEGKGMEGKGIEQKGREGREGREASTFSSCMDELKREPTLEAAVNAVYASNDSFRTVNRMHIENALTGQPDRLKWHPAISGMAAKFAGVKMELPNNSLNNWLAGKPPRGTDRLEVSEL